MTESWVVFSDFDGSLTTRGLLEGLLGEFAPDASRPLLAAVKAGHLSPRTAIAALHHLLPSARQHAYLTWIRANSRLRHGVDDCMAMLASRHVPFYLVSNTLDVFIEAVVGRRLRDRQIYCNRSYWTQSRVGVEHPFPCSPVICQADCGLCKPTVIRWLTPPGVRTVFIGHQALDALTVPRVDVIFARDRLKEVLEANNVPHFTYDDFTDITRQLNDYWAAA